MQLMACIVLYLVHSCGACGVLTSALGSSLNEGHFRSPSPNNRSNVVHRFIYGCTVLTGLVFVIVVIMAPSSQPRTLPAAE